MEIKKNWILRGKNNEGLIRINEIKANGIHVYSYLSNVKKQYESSLVGVHEYFEPYIYPSSKWRRKDGTIQDGSVLKISETMVSIWIDSYALNYPSAESFLDFWEPAVVDEITIDSVWKRKGGGTLFYVGNIDSSIYPIDYYDMDGNMVGCNSRERFLDRFEFVRSNRVVAEPETVKSGNAREILLEAADVMVERGKQYDGSNEERSMAKIVASFNAKTGRDLTELEGWIFMTDLKAVRALNGGSRDCFVDGAAYFALAGESIDG